MVLLNIASCTQKIIVLGLIEENISLQVQVHVTQLVRMSMIMRIYK